MRARRTGSFFWVTSTSERARLARPHPRARPAEGSEALLLMPLHFAFDEVLLARQGSATKKQCRGSLELVQANNNSYWLSVHQIDPYREIKYNLEVHLIQ